jgi:hypothetical protein
MFLGAVFMLLGFLMPSARDQLARLYGPTFLPVTGLILVLGVTGLVGYWRMRKWGVYMYVAMIIMSSATV